MFTGRAGTAEPRSCDPLGQPAQHWILMRRARRRQVAEAPGVSHDPVANPACSATGSPGHGTAATAQPGRGGAASIITGPSLGGRAGQRPVACARCVCRRRRVNIAG
jgi:hypothetical protein